MQASDLAGIHRRGSESHRAGLSFHENPFYFADVPITTPENLLDWHDCCLSWASAWLTEDTGRDKAVRALLQVKYW